MYRSLKLWVTLLVCIFCSGIIRAQQASVIFENTSIEGLPSDFIICVLQDSHGFIWLGTGNGLVKFDGYKLRTFRTDPDDSTSLIKNQVIEIYEDSKGFLWVGTSEWACRFDPHTEKFKRLVANKNNPYAFKYVQNIVEDREGNIWMGGGFKGEFRKVDPVTGVFSSHNYAEDLDLVTEKNTSFYTGIRTVYKDLRNTMWIATEKGLFQLMHADNDPGITFQKFNQLASGQKIDNDLIHSIYHSGGDTLWILTGGNGLYSINYQSGEITHYGHPPNHMISVNKVLSKQSFAEDEWGNLWIITLEDIYIFDRTKRVFLTDSEVQARFPGKPEGPYYALVKDRSGILWLTGSEGLFKIDPHKNNFGTLVTYLIGNGQPSGKGVIAIEEIHPDKILFGTMNGGLFIWDKKAKNVMNIRSDPSDMYALRSNIVSAIHKDRKNRIWVANGENISLFDINQNRFIHTKLIHDFLDNSSFSSVFTIFEDRKGMLWLGTSNGYIIFNPEERTYKTFPFDPSGNTYSVSDWWVLNIFEDHLGNFWMGLGSQGWNRLNPVSGQMTHFEYDQSISGSVSSNTGSAIFQDSKNNVWLGTADGGLSRYDYQTDSFTHFTTRDGLPGNSIYSIIEDDQGYLWLATENGICRFSYREKAVMNFNAGEGLQSHLFAGNYSESVGKKGSDGTIYFGGVNGLNAFQPGLIKPNTYIPPVVITAFNIANKPLPGIMDGSKITLQPNDNFFTIEFAALNYTNSSGNQYAYKLEGFDNDWNYSGSRREAAYTKVPPGQYTFKVKGSNNSGIWNEKGISVFITVLPPWWRTQTAYVIYGVLSLLAILGLFHMQRQRIIKEQQAGILRKELEHAQEIEHAYNELKSTQAQLIHSEKMASLGELTAGIAHEIQNPLNFVNNFSEVNKDLADELVTEADNGNLSEVQLLAKNIRENEEKISHHGKRADAIVKSMLQHSRSSSGQKEPTDINALCDEYLRLAYHGFRAKDKNFNATLVTEFDESVGKINIVPQDIGRVLLNLYNNAFYALQAEALAKIAALQTEAGANKNLSGLTSAMANNAYSPTLGVRTRKKNDQVMISISDNGAGIPEKMKGKIFQPFFTTKPTGQGPGLGLSISYDIVKAHGGDLIVESEQGIGTTMTILIHLT